MMARAPESARHGLASVQPRGRAHSGLQDHAARGERRMEIKHTGVYVGANRHHRGPVIRLTVDFGRADGERIAKELPPAMEKLASWGDSREWLDGARSPGIAMACLARELLKRSGGKADFCR